LLLTLVVAGSCLVEYCGARWFSSFSASRQNRIAIAMLGVCALALAVFRTNMVATDCFVLVVALVAGMLLSRQIGSVGALTAMLIVAAVADLVSTHAGPSRWLVAHAQHGRGAIVLQLLAISLRWKGQFVGVIGASDLMFFATVVSVVRRLGWPETAALVVPLAGILSALAVGLFAGFTPALPFLAGAVWLYSYGSGAQGHEMCRG
jgi:membrane-associated HD superfamily phosphohydrolase